MAGKYSYQCVEWSKIECGTLYIGVRSSEVVDFQVGLRGIRGYLGAMSALVDANDISV